MIQNTEPIKTAWTQKAVERMRSITDTGDDGGRCPGKQQECCPENACNAVAQVGGHSGQTMEAFAEPSARPPVMNGPFGKCPVNPPTKEEERDGYERNQHRVFHERVHDGF